MIGTYCTHQDSELMYWHYILYNGEKNIEVVFKCNNCRREFARRIQDEFAIKCFIKTHQDKYKQNI